MAGAEGSVIPDIELHLIGPLQSNKVRDAVALFDAIHTVDRHKIAAALAEEMASTGGGRGSSCRSTPARSRRRPACSRRDADAFVALSRDTSARHRRADVHPAGRTSSRRRISRCSPRSRGASACRSLSMGMSADFETAIRLRRDRCAGRQRDLRRARETQR